MITVDLGAVVQKKDPSFPWIRKVNHFGTGMVLRIMLLLASVTITPSVDRASNTTWKITEIENTIIYDHL